MLDNLKAWWSTLADRERGMLTIGGVVVGVFVIYSAIWSPLSNVVSDYNVQVKSQRALLLYLQKAEDRIAALKREGVQASLAASSTANLLSLVEQTLGQHQLSAFLKQVQQPSGNEVTLLFEKVPLDQLMACLQQLVTTNGVKVVSLSADRLPVLGSANVKLVLSKV